MDSCTFSIQKEKLSPTETTERETGCKQRRSLSAFISRGGASLLSLVTFYCSAFLYIRAWCVAAFDIRRALA
jgi:hypothetical protein